MGLSPPAQRTGHIIMTTDKMPLLLLVAVAPWLFVLVSSQAVDKEPVDPLCPFVNGSCPVTLDNVVDIYFFDIADRISCQTMCKNINDCKNFTMYGVADSPKDHMKCFLFKSCEYLELCDECTTGPEEPPIAECLGGNYTCATERDNIVDVYYFDVDDSESCPHQCSVIPECNFWTQYHVDDAPQPHHKCFLFKTCNTHEPCSYCETGDKTRILSRGPWH